MPNFDYRTVEMNIKQLEKHYQLDEVTLRYCPHKQTYILDMVRRFALDDEFIMVDHGAPVPILCQTPLNLLKAALTTWIPSLKFGWLKPRYYNIQPHATVYLVYDMKDYPLPNDDTKWRAYVYDNNDRIAYERDSRRLRDNWRW